MATGTATLDFGAFPGASDASLAITGQASIASGSLVEAWLRPVATADHTADEHMLETLRVFAANIVAGTGFTIYGFNTSQLNEPLAPARQTPDVVVAAAATTKAAEQTGRSPVEGVGGIGTRIWGTWTVAWAWV